MNEKKYWKKDVLKVIQNIFYKNKTIDDLFLMDFSSIKNDRLLFLSNKISLELSIENNSLKLENIVLSNLYQNKGLVRLFIKQLIDLVNNLYYLQELEVCNILSSKISHICDSFNMIHIQNYNYGTVDENLYDIDGFFGNRKFIKNNKTIEKS